MASKRKATRRRAKGTGSVFQNQDGSWTAALTIGGSYVRRRAASEQAAESELVELIALRDAKIRIRDGAQSLHDFLTTWFRDVFLERGIRPRTAETCKGRIEHHVLPYLGERRLDSLEASVIQRWVNDLSHNISADAACKAFAILRRALKVARTWKYIKEDPCEGVSLPMVRRKEPRAFTHEECRALLSAVISDRLAALYLVAIVLGLRLGELLGLRWVDLDWAKAELKVTQQVQVVAGELVIAPPKTDNSKRVLPVPPHVLAALRALWGARQVERRRPGWREHGLIFCSSVGTPKAPRNLERDYYAARTRAGLPDDLNFHLLRHTTATMLDEAGASEAIKAAILGHGKKTITQQYTHARLAAMRRVIEAIEQELIGEWGETRETTA